MKLLCNGTAIKVLAGIAPRNIKCRNLNWSWNVVHIPAKSVNELWVACFSLSLAYAVKGYKSERDQFHEVALQGKTFGFYHTTEVQKRFMEPALFYEIDLFDLTYQLTFSI